MPILLYLCAHATQGGLELEILEFIFNLFLGICWSLGLVCNVIHVVVAYVIIAIIVYRTRMLDTRIRVSTTNNVYFYNLQMMMHFPCCI